MKKILFSLSFLLIGSFAFAQSDFEKAMAETITKLETSKTDDDLQAVSNSFDRIGKIENNWLTYYYAAFSQIQRGRLLMRENKTEQLDEIADIAEKYLSVAKEKQPEEAEIYILYKMIHGLRLMVNPMERWQKEGKLAAEALAKAEELSPDNPRITMLKAEDAYFTPEQFGGSKEKGIELFRTSLEQFNTFKPASSIAPNWGKDEAEYFLSQEK